MRRALVGPGRWLRRRFTATCQADNEEVLDLVGDLGEMRTTAAGSGLVEAQVELPAVDERGLLHLLRAAAGERLVFRPPGRPAGGASP